MWSLSNQLAENSMLAPRLYAALNGGRPGTAEAIFTISATALDVPSGKIFAGPGGIGRYLAAWSDSFRDARAEVIEIRACAEGAVIELNFSGTHTAALETMAGRIAATGSHVEIRVCDVMDIEQGAICGLRSYYDAATLLSQLGLPAAHPPGTARA